MKDNHEVIRFPVPNKPVPCGAMLSGDEVARTSVYRTVNMRRQFWAIDGHVTGLDVMYRETHPTEMNIVIGYRCEVCNRTFFAAELNDFSHECMIQ